MGLKTKIKQENNTIIGIALIGAAVLLIWLFFWNTNSLIPSNIKKQLNFNAFYPESSASTQINPSSFSYQSSQNTLSIDVIYENTSITLTEQKAPGNVVANPALASQQLGVHPYTQFQTKLGLVSLTKLYQENSYSFQGQLGVLVAKGTILLAHSVQSLTNEQWKQFFDSLQ